MADSSPAAGQVRLTHVFEAPRELVFAAWLDPDQMARWWPPPGFEIPLDSVEIEPRVGGRFDFTMAAVDGSASFPYRATIAELVEPELIVIRAEPIPGAGIAATVTRAVFEADGDRTRMSVTSGPYTEEVRPSAEAGWTAGIASLERLLAGA